MITKLRIFVSSPGDVSEERALSARVFERLSREFSDYVELVVVLWEHEPLFGHAHFQEQIERPSQCDLVVCILWSRLGTRLPSNYVMAPGETAPTGTEFEVRDALSAYKTLGKPNLLIYRKTAPPQVNLASAEAEERLRQYRMLDEFCQRAFYDEQGEVLIAHRSYAEACEFERVLTDHVRKWLERQVGDAVYRPRWTHGSPYRGLQTFEAEHREIYFGRGQAVSDLIKRMREVEARIGQGASPTRFLLVQGMSGNGKSSLIRAGLLPLLEGRALEGIGLWRQVVIKPSDRPGKNSDTGVLGALAESLAQALPALSDSYPDTEQLALRLRSAPAEGVARLDGYLAREATRAGLRPDQIRLVVFVDQLEELFAPAASATDRAAFVGVVRTLSAEGRVWVIATLRSDFASRLEESPELASLSREGQVYLLGPPQPDELADIIREPARAAGLDWEIRGGVTLDQAILREATGNSESLPLLEYALDCLYDKRVGRKLTYGTYEALGGLRGGIAAAAEATLTACDYSPDSFTRLMRALISVDENGAATRRYALISEFNDQGAPNQLLGALVERRLCVTDRRGKDSVVYFAHEALIQFWPRVLDWLAHEAGLMQVRELAQRDSVLWQNHDKSNAWLATRDKLRAFESLQSAQMILPQSVTEFIDRSRRRAGRNSRVSQLIAGSIVLLAISSTILGVRYKRERDAALHSEQRAQLEAQTALATSDFLVGLFKVVDPSESHGNTITAREILDKGAGQIRSELQAQPAIRNRLLRTMGEVYANLGLYAEAEPLLREVLQDSSRPDASDVLDVARTKQALGRLLVNEEKYEPAESLLVDSMRTFDGNAASGRDSAIIRADLGFLYWSDNDYKRAQQILEEALKRANTSFGHQSGEVATILSTLGITLRDLGDAASGLKMLEESADIYRKIFGDSYIWYAMDRQDIGFTLVRLGRYEEARSNILAAIAIMERELGSEHALLGVAWQGLGSANAELGQYKEARQYLQHAMAIFLKTNGAESKEVGRTLFYIAETYAGEKDFKPALEALRQSTRIAKFNYGDKSTEYVTALNSLALTQRRAGYIEDARATMVEAVAIAENQQGDPLRLLSVLNGLADILCFRGPDLRGFNLASRAAALLGTANALPVNVVASTVAYCDPYPLNIPRNERILKQSLDEIVRIKGPTSPQAEDAERRVARFHSTWRKHVD